MIDSAVIETTQLQTRLDDLCLKLRTQGHRLTPQRMAVVRVLFSSSDHPTIENIYERVNTEFPMTSLATVYKTINMLKELEEVRELQFSGEGSRYDAHKSLSNSASHSHLICTKCKMIVDLDSVNIADAADQAERESGFLITDQRLDFFGVCPACQKED